MVDKNKQASIPATGLGSLSGTSVRVGAGSLLSSVNGSRSIDTFSGINVKNVNADTLELNANKILLTFDMDYVHGMLEKCTIEHMELLLKHLDHIKLQIEKKVFERT